MPRPKTPPVECWQPVVSASPRALDFMAKHDIQGIIGGGAAPAGPTRRSSTPSARRAARAGREGQLGEGLCIGFSFHIADSVEQGIKEATPFFEENIKMFAPLGFVPGLTPEQIDAVRPGAAAGAPPACRPWSTTCKVGHVADRAAGELTAQLMDISDVSRPRGRERRSAWARRRR